MSEQRQRVEAEQLAAEKWPDYGTVIGNVSLANYREIFIDGYMSAIAEAEKAWEDHHGDTGA